MDLNIFTVLLFTLFTAGHSLKCHQCSSEIGPCLFFNVHEVECPTGNTCLSQTIVQSTGGISHSSQIKGCTEPWMCVNGSVNIGFSRTAVSMQCCNTDLCNKQNVPDSSSKNLNGKQCYSCNDKGSCFNKVTCAGTEDYCMKAKAKSVSMTIKGCASKTMCDVLSQLNEMYADVSCCQGNLCNSAKSINQNLLLLLSWPFISYILFH